MMDLEHLTNEELAGEISDAAGRLNSLLSAAGKRGLRVDVETAEMEEHGGGRYQLIAVSVFERLGLQPDSKHDNVMFFSSEQLGNPWDIKAPSEDDTYFTIEKRDGREGE